MCNLLYSEYFRDNYQLNCNRKLLNASCVFEIVDVICLLTPAVSSTMLASVKLVKQTDRQTNVV